MLLTIQVVDAQDFSLQSEFFGIEEGLSHRNVQCIHQDRQGIIWLGTKYGLNRFDGYNFEWFTQEKNQLQSNEINHILEDQEGLMWLIETGGSNIYYIKSISVFDPENHTVQSFEEKFGSTLPFQLSSVLSFAQNEEGQFVFITKQNQLITYTESWNNYTINLGKFKKLHKIYWSPAEQFWVTLEEEAGLQKLLTFDSQAKLLNELKYDNSYYLHIYGLQKDGSGKYFSAYNNIPQNRKQVKFFQIDSLGISSIDTNTVYNHFSSELYDFGPLGSMLESSFYFWVIGDQKRFNVIEKESRKTIAILNNQSPNFETTNHLFADKNNSVWIATQFGLYHFNSKKTPFKKYLSNQKEKGNNDLFACRQITKDHENNLWIRVETPQEVWKINLEKNTSNNVSTKYSDLPAVPRISNTNYAIFQISNQDILYSGSRKFFRVNPHTHEYQLLDSGLSARGIWNFYEDKTGKIWFHDQPHNELGYLEKDTIIRLTERLTETERPYLYQFFETQDSNIILLVTSNGIFTFDIKSQKIGNRYWSKGNGKYFFPFDNIFHIQPDKDGTLWFATGSTGLIHVNFSKDSFTILQQYTRADGLPDNTIYAVYNDSEDNLWMSSDYGIIKFNKRLQRFTGYTEKDGISHNEFNRVSHYQDEGGNIYFGGLNGITAFDPKDFIQDTISNHAKIVITNFEQFDKERNQLVNKLSEIRKQKTITIQPDDRFFRLEFTLLTYEETSKIQYAYQIEGVDQDWNYQKENTIRISTLPYGQYDLRIKGQAANGQWSKHELIIKIKVLKPFYLQTWFLLVSILGFIAGAITFFFWRVSRLKKRQKELEQTVAERTKEIIEDKKIIEQQSEDLKSLEKLKSRFFANVSHELRTPLTLMLGPVNSLLKRMKKNEEETKLLQFVQRNGQQLQKLINEILDLSKLENNKLEIFEEPVPLYSYLKIQLAQFSSAAQSEQQNFEFNFKGNQSLHILLDKNKFEKILHNFLSNAIKNTPINGNITLTVKHNNEDLFLSVEDSGKGIHPDDLSHVFDRFFQSNQPNVNTKGGTGIGLSLCKELAELLGGKVWAISELNVGSTFYLELPLKEVQNSSLTESSPEIDDSLIPPSPLSDLTFEEISSADKKSTTILIVEDNKDLLDFLTYLLSDFQVLTAQHGQAALDILNNLSSPPDMIISDLMMPVMDGFEFLEKIKSDNRWRHLPVIMLTAKANIRSKIKALRVGVDDYLLKPFQEEELLARIENLLRNYRERMHVFKNIEASKPENIEEGLPVVSLVDAQWLEEVEIVFGKNMSDTSFSIDKASTILYISTRQFQRKLKQITGLTPKQYLQEMQLQKAKDYLIIGKYSTVKETAFAVGFRNVRNFSTSFRQHFGVSPSFYLV